MHTFISSDDKHIIVFDKRANALCDIPPITARHVLKFCNSLKYYTKQNRLLKDF